MQRGLTGSGFRSRREKTPPRKSCKAQAWALCDSPLVEAGKTFGNEKPMRREDKGETRTLRGELGDGLRSLGEFAGTPNGVEKERESKETITLGGPEVA